MKHLLLGLIVLTGFSPAWARNADLLNKALSTSLRERAAVQRAYGAQVPKEEIKTAPAEVDKSIKIDVGDDLGGSTGGGSEVGMAFRTREAKAADDYKAQIQEIEKTVIDDHGHEMKNPEVKEQVGKSGSKVDVKSQIKSPTKTMLKSPEAQKIGKKKTKRS